MLSLRDLQSRFFYSIARPMQSAGEEWQGFDAQLLAVIQPQGQLGPDDRLDIYAQMYCARLLDILVEDFPRVGAILGEEQFRALGREYLRHYPSAHPSLRYLGAHVPAFLARHAGATTLPFLSELARLEQTRLAVFDAPDVEVLQLADLQTIPADAWATIRFQVIPALETLACLWPVHMVWKDNAFTQADSLPAEPTVLRVWRQDFAVYQASMDAVEQTALTAMQAGESFAAVCAEIEPMITTSDDVATVVGSILLRWIEDGIVAHEYFV